ncbi:hypothetical protein MAR_036865 [Mya arenaria]|uniref:Uncharacterized protein n=1 Tax=Mya arenaria TaxID=6604 RepID=A0ABY7FR55_MYAAR|nr:hypothetical protein MAR_036865 [Mya arenaria]
MASEEINFVLNNGLEIYIDEEKVTVTLSLLCVTLDLPAKVGALNMTYYNGSDACITCEGSGLTVRQGRGHSRSYSYRTQESRYPIRSHAGVLEHMNASSAKNRLKGFKVTVPDYMHGVLLGLTKTLMSKWISGSETGKEYFVGKKLKQVSLKLLNIKPSYHIERLPRDLEKHYANFKATEVLAYFTVLLISMHECYFTRKVCAAFSSSV